MSCTTVMTSSVGLLLVPILATGQQLAFRDSAQSFVVTNRYYRASVSKQTGELYSLVDRLRGRAVVSGDRLIVRVKARRDSIGLTDFSDARLSIADGFDFYIRAVWQGTLAGSAGRQRIERTYEFTNSPHVYEQVVILVAGVPAEPAEAKLGLHEVTWEFRRESGSTVIRQNAEDLWTELPGGPMGGLELKLTGHAFTTRFDDDAANPRRHIVVSGRVQDAASTSAELSGGHGLVAASVISIVGPWPEDPTLYQPLHRFYPGYGLRQVDSESTFTFVNWNTYDVSNLLIPLRRKYVDSPTANDWLNEDALIRITMHLADRMKLDGGWPQWPAWTGAVTYPRGDIFTAHSRAFPAMAYLWSYLTIEWEAGRWVHSQKDADLIYNQLQQLRRFYGVGPDSSSVNFRDRHEGVDYIAYSASRKETLGNGPRGVLNTHAQALLFAWIMKEASDLRGSSEDARKWRAIVELYQPGSKTLYRLLYPGARNCRVVGKPGTRRASDCDFVSGHVAYSIDNPCIYPGCSAVGAHPLYSLISHEGIAPGYLEAGEYEPEFVDAVERASRPDYNPYGPRSPSPLGPLVARLCRVLPLALAFTGDSVSMVIPSDGTGGTPHHLQYDISVAGLREVSTLARLRFQQLLDTRGEHDPQRVIGEQAGQGLRTVIWTNKRFVTDWIPGFWEEKDTADVPPNLRFSVDVRPSHGGRVGVWAAYRTAKRIEVMADFDDASVVLRIPSTGPETAYLTGYRDYDASTLRWKDPVSDIWKPLPPGGELVLPSLLRKRLVFVDLR